MEYLTTHDLVWINSTITGKVNSYNYTTLEAAMAGQYSYGESFDVPRQAANLLERLVAKSPFSEGNVRTALIGALSFLDANGYAVRVSDQEAADIVRSLVGGAISAYDAVCRISAPAEAPLGSTLTLRRLIGHECNHHKAALELLAAGD